MPAVSSRSKVIVAREKNGQSDPICQKDGGRISGSTLGPNARDPINRYATLEHILADNKQNATTTRYRQRITLLLGTHELEAAEKSLSGVECPKGVSSKTLAIRKLACCLQTDNNKIINDNKRPRHYVRVYKKIGPVAFLLLGGGDDSLNL